MMFDLPFVVKALFRLRGYEPQPVTFLRIWQWIRQFPRDHHENLLRLLSDVRLITRKQTLATLLSCNEEILRRLEKDGVGVRDVVYVEMDSAGSSSGVMLHLLRNHARLLQRGATFVHSTSVEEVRRATQKIGRGALVYVDDFSGSGDQFIQNRGHVIQYLPNTFSEFFLTACICEEAWLRLDAKGIVPVTGLILWKRTRPLHADSVVLDPDVRSELVQLCLQVGPAGLGYRDLATNIVLYSNAPDSTPLVLRGSVGQKPYRGVLPRYQDL